MSSRSTMGLGVSCWWRWLLVFPLVYGLGAASGDLARHRRQSNWWQSNQRSVSGQGASRWGVRDAAGLGILRRESRLGWGAGGLSSGGFPRQVQQPPRSPIRIQCTEDNILVNVSRDFYRNGIVVKPTDLTLGPQSCKPLSHSPDQVAFKNKLQECGSNLQVTPNYLIYASTLNYNPSPNGGILRSSPAMVPIQCVYSRHGNVSSNAVVPTWAPFRTTVSSVDRLLFSLHLMTDDWLGPRSSTVFHLGEMLYIEASVDTQNHIPLLLFIDRCVATTSSDPGSKPSYDIITANGCLVDGRQEDASSSFRSPRIQQDKLQFTVDVFRFLGVDMSIIYITCFVKAVEATHVPDPMNKACSYSKATNSWSPVEGIRNICQCCNMGTCSAPVGQSRFWNPERPRRIGKRDVGQHAEYGQAVLGPILVMGAEGQPVSQAGFGQTLTSTEESKPMEFWILVVVASVSLVVVGAGAAVIGKHLLNKLANGKTVDK